MSWGHTPSSLPPAVLLLGCGLLGATIGVLPGQVRPGPLLPLVVSAVLLVAFAIWAWRRTPRAVAGSVTAVALACYLPFRGILLVGARPTPYDGVNPRVIDLLASPEAGVAAVGVLVITSAFLGGYLAAAFLRRPPKELDTTAPSEDREALGSVAIALLAVGCVGLAVQATASLSILRIGSSEGGALPQIRDGLAFCAGLGVLVAPRGRAWPAKSLFHLLLFVSFAIGAVAGSKEVITQILVALFLRQVVLRPHAEGATALPKRRLALVAALIAVLFVVFPALNSYRRAIERDAAAEAALRQVPGDLVRNTIVLGQPRQDNGPGPYAYDALLFVTNRLHGFDSLLLGVSGGRDSEVLTAGALVSSPLTILLPATLVDPDSQDVGQLFARKYWGALPGNPVRVGIGAFTQMWLAFGWPMVVAMGLLVGVLAFVADKALVRGSTAGFMAGYALLLGVLATERDVVFVIASTGRRLLVVLAVSMLIRPLVAGRRAERPVPTAVPVPTE